MKVTLTLDNRFGDANIVTPLTETMNLMWKDPENFDMNHT